MPYTLGQAAKAAGRTKATLQEAIKKGQFSAKKDELGRYQIDPAELHRVYPLVRLPDGQQPHEPDTANPLPAPDPSAEIRHLNDKIEWLERLCRQIEGERDGLREQNARLVALLPAPKPQPAPPHRPWWLWLWPWQG
jgi:hypothetical protein